MNQGLNTTNSWSSRITTCVFFALISFYQNFGHLLLNIHPKIMISLWFSVKNNESWTNHSWRKITVNRKSVPQIIRFKCNTTFLNEASNSIEYILNATCIKWLKLISIKQSTHRFRRFDRFPSSLGIDPLK